MTGLDGCQLTWFLLAGAWLAGCGFFMTMRSGSAYGLLAGSMLMATGVNVCLTTFSRATAGNFTGDVFALFVIVLFLNRSLVSAAQRHRAPGGEERK